MAGRSGRGGRAWRRRRRSLGASARSCSCSAGKVQVSVAIDSPSSTSGSRGGCRGSTTTTGSRPYTAEPRRRLGPEPAQYRGRRVHRAGRHHAQDLVGGERLAASRDPVAAAAAGEALTRRWRSPRAARRGAAAGNPPLRGSGALNASRPRASRSSTRTTSPRDRRLALEEPAVARHRSSPAATSTTSRAASAASPTISRASAGPAQTTTVTG